MLRSILFNRESTYSRFLQGANQNYKARRADTIISVISKFSGRCTDLSRFIYYLVPNQTNKNIKTTLEIEEYVGRTYRKDVRKSINELEIKVRAFINREDLTMDQYLSLIHIEIYELKIQHWFNMSKTYKQAIRVMYRIFYGECTNTMKHKLETFPVFVPTEDKQDQESSILLLKLIKSICYNLR